MQVGVFFVPMKRMGILRLLLAVASLGLLVLEAKLAHAQGDKAARAQFQRAEKAFNVGKFDDALKFYEGAFDAKPLPGFLFNMAQCHRNLGDPERAIFFFQRYLSLDPETPNRPLALELIAEEQKKLDAKRAPIQKPPPAPEPPPVAPSPAPPPVRIEVVPIAAPLVVPAPTPPSQPVYKKWWFWTGAAVVLGGVVAALVVTKQGPAPSGQLDTIRLDR